MKRFLLSLFAFQLLCCSAFGQAKWTKTFGEHKSSYANDVARTNDGGFILAGAATAYGPSGYSSTLRNPILIKTDSVGNMQWQKVYGTNTNDDATDVVQVPNGDIFVLGQVSPSYNNDDISLTKFDANGNLIWQQTYGGSNRDFPGGMVAVGNDVVITATLNYNAPSPTLADVMLFKVDNSGATIWNHTYGSASTYESSDGICNLHDGGFLLSGQYRTGSSNTGYAIRTNATGDTLWTKIVSSIGVATNFIGLWDCTQLLGDTVLVLVGSAPSTFNNLCVVKMDLNGNVINTFVSSFLADRANDVEPLDDGGYIVAGTYANFGSLAALYRFDAMGNSYFWHKRYFGMGGSSYFGYSNSTSVLADDDGGFIIGGSVSIFSDTYNDDKMLLMKLDPWGNNAIYGSVVPTVSQPDTVCAGDQITISVPDVFDHYQWFWYNNNGKVNWIPDSDTSSIAVDSSWYYRCVMWNNNGEYIISGNAFAIVSNFPDSTISLLGYPQNCPPYNSLRVDIEPGTSITWFLNGNVLLAGSNGYLNPSASGFYTAQVSNACTTLTTDPVFVNVNQPVFDIGPDTIYIKYYNGALAGCYPVRLNAASSGGSVYSWYKNGGLLPNTTSYLDPTTEGYYYATVSNSCGLIYTDTTWVVYDTVFSYLEYSASQSLTGCNNRYLEFRVDNFEHSQAANSWKWYKNGVLVSQQFYGDPTAGGFRPGNVNPGTVLDSGYYYCIVSDTCGSFSFDNITDTVYYKEDQSLNSLFVVGGGQPITCFGSSVTISATQSGSSYQWYKDSVLMPGATLQQLVVTSSGEYRCYITRSCGLYSSNSMRVWIGTPPGIIVSDFTAICNNGTDTTKVRMQAQTLSYINTYQWRKNGINIPGAVGYYYDTKSPGVYDCIFSYPCDTLYSNQITLNDYTIPKTITSDNYGKFCPGGTVELQAAPGYYYQWYMNNGNALIPGANDSVYLADTTNNYRVVISNGLCQVFSEFEYISQQNPPVPNFIIPSTPPLSCGGGPVNLVANSRPDFSYQWQLNSLPVIGATSSEYLASGSGEFTVALSDSIGCETVSTPLVVDDSYSGNITLNLAAISNQCAGDTINITVNGSYQSYQWYYNNVPIPGAVTSTYVTDSAGVFSVLVTDNNGCAGSASASISFAPAPVINSLVSSPASCSINNGSINIIFSTPVDLSISGPTTISPQYGIYSFVNSALSSGWYYITYAPSGGSCSFTDSIEVLSTGSYPVQINAGTGTICQGQYINAGLGTTGMQILWNTGQTSFYIIPPVTGWYTLTLTDTITGCTGIDSAFVTVNLLPAVGIQPPGPVVLCGPGSVMLDAGSGYSQYQWSNGLQSQTISVQFSGTYVVTVTDLNGCTNRDTVVVTSQPLPALTNTANGPTSFCVGGSVQLSVTGSSGSLQWHRYNIPVAGATSAVLNVTSAGSYRCLITDAFGCTAFSNPITVTTPCQPPQNPVDKIGEVDASSMGIAVYPNPGLDVFELIIDENIVISDFNIIDLSGRAVINASSLSAIDSLHYRFRLSFTKSGIYFIHITDQFGRLYRLKLIKL